MPAFWFRACLLLPSTPLYFRQPRHNRHLWPLYCQVPGALTFTKLRTIADQFYYNCQGVRTADDASLTIKVRTPRHAVVLYQWAPTHLERCRTADEPPPTNSPTTIMHLYHM